MAHEKTRLLVVTSSFPKFEGDSNGAFVFELASRLQQDFEVFVLAPMFNGAQRDSFIGNLRVYRHKQFVHGSAELAYGSGMVQNLARNPLLPLVIPFFLAYQFWAIRKICSEHQIQMIHAHWIIPQGFMAILYKKLLRPELKVMVTIHGSDINKFDGWLGSRLKRFVLRNLDTLTVVSQAIKAKVAALGYSKEIFVCPMGVDTSLFTPKKANPNIKDQYGISGPMILFVGRLIQQKGIKDLINAMPLVLDSFPYAKLIVVGDGNLKNDIVSLCATLGISDSVIFTNSITHSELPPYYATADLFVLPSYSEGWPVVVMEALSSGTIPVVSNIPVFTKHELNDLDFRVVEAGDHLSIANGINDTLSDSNMLQSEQAHLRKYALSNLDWHVVSKKYTNLITSSCNN